MKGLSIVTIAVLLGACMAVFFFDVDAAEALTIKVNHDHVNIGFSYNGSTVSVKGKSGKDTDLVVTIASVEQHKQILRQKGHVGGILWMNVGEVAFGNVPSVYMVHSTRDIDAIMEPEMKEVFEIGYPAIMEEADISGVEDGEKERWFAEFIKLKEASHLYSTIAGNISIMEDDGGRAYALYVDWPYQAEPGDYLVTVCEVKDGKVVDTAKAGLLVEQVGMVKTLSDMAQNNGALYGIVAVLIALSAGFGVGVIFKKGGGAH